jgi:hypothetical protein
MQGASLTTSKRYLFRYILGYPVKDLLDILSELALGELSGRSGNPDHLVVNLEGMLTQELLLKVLMPKTRCVSVFIR